MRPMDLNLRIRSRLDEARRRWLAHEARMASGVKTGFSQQHLFFGAQKHRFELSPPLPPQTVEQWEREFGVALPEDYRRFLLEVGGHGAGPSYGLESLRAALGAKAEQRQFLRAWYQAPCPLREDMPLGREDKEAWLVAIGGPEWEARFNADEWSPDQGTLSLCEVGCGAEIVLVLNGPLRGRTCELCGVWQQPLLSRAPDFLGWYEGWLEEVLAGGSED